MSHRRITALAVVAIAVMLQTGDGIAHPGHYNTTFLEARRKFPWKGGVTHEINDLPCALGGDHCGQSNEQAIDFDMATGTQIYSVSAGIYHASGCPTGSGTGNYVVTMSEDGTFITYEHLRNCTQPQPGTSFSAGQPILISGCTGTCSGPHVHVQRGQFAPTFTSADQASDLRVDPISGHGGLHDTLCDECDYPSDNAGPGYDSADNRHQPFVQEWYDLGSYTGIGVTANVADSWSPCRNDTIWGSFFRYTCAPAGSGYDGIVQTFCGYANTSCSSGLDVNQSALMQARPTSSFSVHHVPRATLRAYTQLYNGQDWVFWIGYPTSDRIITDDDPPTINERQTFQDGYIDYTQVLTTGTCTVRIYEAGVLRATYSYCD